ncbi:MAG: hypothetical protein LBH82_04725 [Bacteroidales bacterium]|jgi:hypothetical protein|nr:hypothetical protein [Bacteroidales bacterium]
MKTKEIKSALTQNNKMLTTTSCLLKRMLPLFLVCGYSFSLSAQSQFDVIVNSQFSPTLSDAQQKINEKARIVDTVKISKPVQYNIAAPAFGTTFIPEIIKAPRVGKDQIARLYRNFVKAGFGNYWTPYLDFEINNLRSTKLACGISVFHHSSWGKIKNYPPSAFSDTKAEAYLQKFFKKGFTLNTKAGYEHTMVHYYGFPDSLIHLDAYRNIKAKDLRRDYHHAYAKVNFSNNDVYKNKLNQDYTLHYDYLTANKTIFHEHQLGFLAALNHDIKLKRFSSFNAGGEIGADYFNYRYRRGYVSNFMLLNVKPHVTFKYKEYYFKAGFDLVFHFGEKVRFYPDIDFRLHIVPEIFTFYAGMGGGYKRNSVLSLMQENPYLASLPHLGFQDEKFNFFAGIQLGLSRSLSIGARGLFAVYDGMPVFMKDYHPIGNIPQSLYYDNRPQLLYYDNSFVVLEERANLLNLHFDLKYRLKNKLWLTFNVDYNKYAIPASSDLLRVWYKPSFVGGFDIEYLLLEKFKFGLNIYMQAGAKCPEVVDNNNIDVASMNAIPDFNFNFEYIWSKRLSFFLDVNNFLHQRNYYYHDYPSQRINIMVGVKYNFGGESVK